MLDEAVCFTSYQYPWERHESNCSDPAIGRIVGQINSFFLIKATSLRDRKLLNSNQLYSAQKLTLCYIFPVMVGWVNTYMSFLGGICGVMVTIIRNGHSDPSSNSE